MQEYDGQWAQVDLISGPSRPYGIPLSPPSDGQRDPITHAIWYIKGWRNPRIDLMTMAFSVVDTVSKYLARVIGLVSMRRMYLYTCPT